MSVSKSLLEANPDIAHEWHPTKNGNLLPSEVLPNSNIKVWWVGKCGHEWDAVICTRNKGVGCPYCANRKVLAGFNDLQTTNPKLAREWNYEKNAEIYPNTITAGSDKKVWWRCSLCNYEWEAKVANRNRGASCPICMVKKISYKSSEAHLRRSGSLQDTNPKLASEWHYEKNQGISPADVTELSPKKVWWIGSCGHEWNAIIANRSKGNGCPYCTNQKVLVGFNDFKTLYPTFALEWHPTKNGRLTPHDIVAKSNKKVWWLGSCGHEWEQSISKRTSRGQGCPICARMSQTSFPEQALFFYIKQAFPAAINGYHDIFSNEMELDIYIPEIKTAIEYDGANWHSSDAAALRELVKYQICKQHDITLIRVKEKASEYEATVSDISIIGKRHPTSEDLSQTITSVMKCLSASIPVNVAQDAEQIYGQYRRILKYNSLKKLHPEIAVEWNYEKNGQLTPEMFLPRSGIRVWWKCQSCGNEWKTIIAHRTAGSGCPKCKRTK